MGVRMKVSHRPELVDLDYSAAVTIADDATQLALIRNVNQERLCFHFDVAVHDLADLAVFARAHPEAQYVDFTPNWVSLPSGGRILTAVRSTTSTGAVVDGDLDSVTTLQNGYFEMNISGLSDILVVATAGTAGALVTPRWSTQ